jgi:8-oxo-dGTP pyrophosphatase MutT (NUDIX family)
METQALPSTFYRVTAKALIFDDQQRLLVGRTSFGDWEIPGGGWEHDESFEECLRREVKEDIGSPQFVYRGRSSHGWFTIRIIVTASIKNHDFVCGDGITQAKFVSRDEFLTLKFGSSEEGILEHADQIWDNNTTE